MFFGGKGGVGKTTCAAARAIRDAATSRVLIVSTDPAHSLGDALAMKLAARPARVRGAGSRSGASLHAVELDAPRAFARWLATHRSALSDVIDHGTWLDRDDIDALLDLTIPGVDELVGLLEIARLADEGAYDRIIIDTAPTGHTLRLLAAPTTVDAVAGILDSLQEEHRLIRAQFGRVTGAEPADRLIELLATQARATAALLRDRTRATFHWVTLAEELSLAETEDALESLDAAHLRVDDIVVNRVTPDGPPCALCDRRRLEEWPVIQRVARGVGKHRQMHVVPSMVHEPRGVAALRKLGDCLSGPGHPASPRPRRAASRSRAAVRVRPGRGLHALMAACGGARLVFVGGKGGVGKTTTAAAAAIELARSHPEGRVLLLSTDPAHSLADVFGVRMGDRATQVRGTPANLSVRELDASAVLAARRTALEAALEEISGALGSAAGGRSSRELIDLAPPGIDELLGMLSVVEAREMYARIVLDTAPTGHTLRLLEMPEAVRAWVQVLLQFLLKYRSLVRPGQLARELVDLSKSVRQLEVLLRAPSESRFIVVTRAAEVPRAETRRLLSHLKRLRMAVPAVVINGLTPSGTRRQSDACPRCRATVAAERGEIAALLTAVRRTHARCAIIQTPLTAPAPRGVAALERWAHTWTS